MNNTMAINKYFENTNGKILPLMFIKLSIKIVKFFLNSIIRDRKIMKNVKF